MKRVFTILCVLALSLSNAQTENCLSFNGASQYVTAGNVNNMGTSDFTIEAWVYFDSTGINTTIGQEIVCKGMTSVGTPSNAGYSLRGFKNVLSADLDFTIGDASGDISRIEYTGLSHNVWYHIAGVRTGKMTLLFVNGVLVGSESTCYVYNVDTDMPFAIGAIDKGGLSPVNEFIYGKIDEVRVWNYQRTNQEIIDNMPCAINVPTPNLVAVYNFDQTTGVVATDASGNNINATLVNGPMWINSPVALQCGPLKIDENENENNLKIYPNPASSMISIEISRGENQNVKIYDLSGKLVTDYLTTLSSSKIYIDINRLAMGTYVVELIDNETGQVLKSKFVKM